MSGRISNKVVVSMWRIYDWLYTEELAAQQVADNLELLEKVYVGVDECFKFIPEEDEPAVIGTSYAFDFFGSWVFTDYEEAVNQVKQFNEE